MFDQILFLVTCGTFVPGKGLTKSDISLFENHLRPIVHDMSLRFPCRTLRGTGKRHTDMAEALGLRSFIYEEGSLGNDEPKSFDQQSAPRRMLYAQRICDTMSNLIILTDPIVAHSFGIAQPGLRTIYRITAVTKGFNCETLLEDPVPHQVPLLRLVR